MLSGHAGEPAASPVQHSIKFKSRAFKSIFMGTKLRTLCSRHGDKVRNQFQPCELLRKVKYNEAIVSSTQSSLELKSRLG